MLGSIVAGRLERAKRRPATSRKSARIECPEQEAECRRALRHAHLVVRVPRSAIMNLLLYATTVLIWGTTWIAIALQVGEVPVMLSVFYRFALAAGVLLLWLSVSGRLHRLGARDHLFCALQGLCVFCLNFYFFYTASAYITSGLIAVVFSMAVLFNAVNGVLFFRQTITTRLLLATALGLAGMVCLFWPDIYRGGLDASVLFGLGCALVGTYGFSLGNMLSLRHQRRGLDLLSTNAYAMGYGALIMLALVLASGTPFAVD